MENRLQEASQTFRVSGNAGTSVPIQALVNDVLRVMLNQFVFVYINDILIFSRSCEEHVTHVRQVLQRLLDNKLFVKAEKCEFHSKTSSKTIVE